MACSSCDQKNYNSSVGSCSTSSTDASNIKYTGPNLTCSDISTNSSVETAIQALDAAICENSGINWASFDYNCLPTLCECEISSASTFVDAITNQLCSIVTTASSFRTDYDNFTDSVESDFNNIVNPELTLTCINVTNSDTIYQIFQKINTSICSINSNLNSPEYSFPCINVGGSDSVFSTIQKIGDEVCSIDSRVTTIENNLLPTFNNSGSCLSTTGTNDSLYSTVVAIRNLLCQKPSLDVEDLSSNCDNVGSDLTSTLNNVLGNLDYLNSKTINSVNVNSESSKVELFITPVDGNPCAGYDLSIRDTGGLDTMVKISSGDSTSDYLANKIVNGAGINIYTDSEEGYETLIIENTNLDSYQLKVKSDGSDTPGYLINKLNTSSSLDGAIVLTDAYESTSDSLVITPSLNYTTLASKILQTIIDDTSLSNIFCTMLACQCECSSPTTNRRLVQIRFRNEGSVPLTFSSNIAQLSTPSTLYSGAVTINNTEGFDTGYFYITDTTSDVKLSITLQNNTNPTELFYHIYATETDGTTPITGSDNVNGALTYGNSVVFDPYASTGYTLGNPLPTNTTIQLYVIVSDSSFD